MNSGKKLFLYNRSILNNVDSYKDMLEIENIWIAKIFDQIKGKTQIIQSRIEFQNLFKDLLAEERNAPSEDTDYISNQLNLDEFRVIIQEFAIDGLTEAQAFFFIIPRLPLTAQMPFLRILIDEFGCGNYQQTHSRLYSQLLLELGMSTNIESYLDIINPESYAFLNIFYWLTMRSENIEYFLGALAYLESIIPFAFKCFADACQRLNIVNHKYYTEHIHIDDFHAKDMARTLWEVESSVGLDYTKVWTGVQIASLITAQAFEAAIKKARNTIISPPAINQNTHDFFDKTYSSEKFSVKLQDKEYLISQNCTHREGRMYCGAINEKSGIITCPLHFSKFDIASGKALSGPASVPLDVIEVVTDKSQAL